jgi:hypothetical protein
VFAATIDEHYLDAMGLTILRGRNFRETDSADAPKVAVVNEQFARHYWPDQDAIGKRFRVAEPNAPQDGKNGWVEIVGLTKTSKYIFLAEPPTDFFYLPYKQQPSPRMLLLAQSAGDPANFAAPLRDVIRNLDASLPISNVRTMEALFHARAISVFNVIIGTVGAMGLMGLGLAIVGLYGLVAYGVSRRTKEIGIRMAIGAGRDAVLRMILQQGLALALAGLVVGLLAGAGAERLLQAAFPSGDNGFHPMALILVTPVVIAVTFVATYIPARRASRVDPIQALRYE